MKHAKLASMSWRMSASAVLTLSLAIVPAIAQEKSPATATVGTETGTRPTRFDVTSVKPANPAGSRHFGFGPDGFSAGGQSLISLIYLAYFPMNMSPKDAVTGAPDWATKDMWDVEAKVAPEDVAYYQQHRPRFDDSVDSMSKQLLQSLLAERFHLVVHTVPAEMDGYAIVVAKNGPRLKEAAPDEPQPSGGIPMPGGGYLVPYRRGDYPHTQFAAVTMSTFAINMRGAGVPVVDRTGLTGRYDFTLNWFSSGPDEAHPGAIEFDDPEKLSHWDFGALGLRADHVKLPSVRIVVDHIERPSEN